MHKVSAWKTDDGQYFDTEKAASRHEAFEGLGKVIAEHLEKADVEELIESLLSNAGNMAILFSKYARLHPQTQAVDDTMALPKEEVETG